MQHLKQVGIIGLLLLTFAGKAQNNFCHTSFSCDQASESNVVIHPAGTGALSQLYNTNGFTWEAWFRLTSPVVNEGIIIATEDAALYEDIFLGFGWGSIPNALSFHVDDDGTNNTVITAESLQSITLNTWYHVAAVCDYGNAILRLYLNGDLVATQALTADLLAHRLSQEHTTCIGNASASLSGSDIDIDEVRFWSTVRTAVQIKGAMKECLSLPQTGLVAWFRADDAGPVTATSAVDANFTATLQNAGYASGAPVGDCYTVAIGQIPSCKTVDLTGTVTSGITVLDWSWDLGDGNTADGQNVSHTYGDFGNETVTLAVKDDAGCGTTATAAIKLVNGAIHTTVDTALCAGGSIEGHTRPGVYTDVFQAASGCDSIRVLNIYGCGVYFPNAFTPNGDGNNDVFKVLNAVDLSDFHLVIYNRWGQLVFETADPGRGWDGRVNGKGVVAGAYVWYCEYGRRGSPQRVQMKGEVMLVR